MSKTSIDETLTHKKIIRTSEEPVVVKETENNVISIELAKLEQMLEVKSEAREMLSQMYRILTLLYRMNARNDKKYALDKEPEIWAEMANVKASYNNRSVVAFKIITGGIQFVAGAIGIGGAFSQSAQAWANISQATGMGAQLPSAISTILGEKSEANRSVYSFMQQVLQKKQEDRNRSTADSEQKTQQVLNEGKQAEKEASEVVRSILYNSAS